MAKKGGAQQLQAEINSDEELYKFLEKPGLLVMDIYSEWCGPCLAMVGSLRKIKLELGGDNLHLAICKSDTIEALTRFRNKSEPTWLFATQGRLVNLMFGTDVPQLMQLIAKELNLLGSTKRKFYDITEMQPEERARRDVIEEALAKAQRKEIEEAERIKIEYLTNVTNEILANLPDMGVTIFGPHVVRDTYKKLMEIAETQKIQCKDRRTTALLPEHFDSINFACENPIDPEVLEHMYNKDLLICFWKVSDLDRNLEDVFLSYVHELTHPRKVVSEFGDVDPETVLPPLLTPLEIKVKMLGDVVEKEQVPVEDVTETDDPLAELVVDKPDEGENEPEGKEQPEETISVASSVGQIILVPPVWVPTDRRTHATLIYVFFRPQTATFLPPDPIPDPPHIVMAFDAYKKKDIFDVIMKNKESILLYGFFTDDNPKTAQLISSSMAKYEAKAPQITDKLVLKVAKKTSHTMLALASFGPSYVSANTVVGKEEALNFFPETYANSETVEEEIKTTDDKEKEKKTPVEEAPATEARASSPAEENAEESTATPAEQETSSAN